jgi:hypothetical protein
MLPSRAKFFNRKQYVTLYPDTHPLTLISNHQSALLTNQIQRIMKGLSKDWRSWLHEQIAMMVEEHAHGAANVHELDLLRASGALHKLGINLGMYRGAGIDCPDCRFKFNGYPEYPCPVEIEESSSGFLASHHAEHRRQRVGLLCMTHNTPHLLRHYVDIIELRELAHLLKEVA